MTTLIKILITVFLSFFCFSCNFMGGVRGKGEVISKERTVNEDYTALKVSRGLDVILIRDSEPKVIVEANENLHDYIEIYVKNNTLYVTAKENIYSADKKDIFVSYEVLNKISASSGAHISSEHIVTEKNLALHVSSGADIDIEVKANEVSTAASSGAMLRVSGETKSHIAKASSGANVRAEKLSSLISEAKASSGANIKIYAENEFTGNASSGGNVAYYGNPQKVEESDSSGGNVQKR